MVTVSVNADKNLASSTLGVEQDVQTLKVLLRLQNTDTVL